MLIHLAWPIDRITHSCSHFYYKNETRLLAAKRAQYAWHNALMKKHGKKSHHYRAFVKPYEYGKGNTEATTPQRYPYVYPPDTTAKPRKGYRMRRTKHYAIEEKICKTQTPT